MKATPMSILVSHTCSAGKINASHSPSLTASCRVRHYSDVDPPNRVLRVSNLPDIATASLLTLLFNQFQGFRDLQADANQKQVYYVEYSSEVEAQTAMNGLQHFKITPEAPMLINFAKNPTY
eukprot:TRINITY_DN461_c0_g1_i1.p1 TRINITY_DN461_c0_g1~~TRINITY_DN461_c0_g1_i1.p1  ORF type:complete len:122 (+),score=8.17 TRINITY_DN461_c0_g1_i1:509-874(+)